MAQLGRQSDGDKEIGARQSFLHLSFKPYLRLMLLA
jgi:hypothetical protein